MKKILRNIAQIALMFAVMLPVASFAAIGTGSPSAGGIGTPGYWQKKNGELTVIPPSENIHVGGCYIGPGLGTPCGGPGAGFAIGDPVGGGTDPSVLFVDAGLVAQDPTNFGYNPSVDFFVKMGNGQLINDTVGYEPVGPLPFIGAKYDTGLTPYDSYSGMFVAGGVGKPIMRVLDGAGKQGLVQVDIATVDLRADIDAVNMTRIAMAAGGSPDISLSTQSNANTVVTNMDPTTNTFSATASDTVGTALLSLFGTLNPNAQLTVNTPGVKAVTVSLDATGNPIFDMSAQIAGGTFGVYQVNTGNSTNISSITNGATAASQTLDASANKLITTTITDGTRTAETILDAAFGISSMTAYDGANNTGGLILDSTTPTAVLQVNDGAGSHASIVQLNGLTGAFSAQTTDGVDTSSYGQTTTLITLTPAIETQLLNGQLISRRQVNDAITTIDDSDFMVTGAGLTVARVFTLPDASTVAGGKIFVIKNKSTSVNVITLTPSAGDTIDGAATLLIAPTDSVTVVSDNGTDWEVI